MPWILAAAGLSGAVAVGLGAGAAHGLEGVIGPVGVEWVRTGVLYQFVHTTSLLAIGLFGLVRPPPRPLALAALAHLAGVVLFCGSLYLMAFTEIRWIARVTPLGGIMFILGWLFIAWAGLGAARSSSSDEANRRNGNP